MAASVTPRSAPGVDEAEHGPERVERRERQVLADALAQQQALRLALLRHVSEAGTHGAARREAAQLRAVERDAAGIQPVRAEQRFEQMPLALADETAEPEDLAALELETHAGEGRTAKVGGGEDGRGVRCGLGGEGFVPRGAAGHQPHRFGFAERAGVGDADQLAVAQHRHAIAEADHLIPAVRDEQRDGAVGLEARHQPVQPLDFGGAERRGRFVEQQHLWLAGDGAHDLQHLLLAERQLADPRVGHDGEAVAGKKLRRLPAQRPPVDAAPGPARRIGEKQVLLDAEIAQQRQFLEHADDAVRQGLMRGPRRDGLASEGDAPGFRQNGAAGDFHQRRLAGAVFRPRARAPCRAPPRP